MTSEGSVIEIDNTQQNSVNLSDNLEYWMSKLPMKLKELPIIKLAIPGKSTLFRNIFAHI